MSTEQTNATSGDEARGAASSTGGPAAPAAGGREGVGSPLVYGLLHLIAAILMPAIARLRVEGREHVPRHGGAILAPNHISWADIPLVAFPLMRRVHFMAKAELFQVPVLGGICRLLGAFAVRRGESDREALRVAERLLSGGHVVVIFPEGHRSEGRALIEAHTGVALIAMRAGVPVIPVAIWGSEEAFRWFHFLWSRPTVTIRYGEPVMLRAAGARRTSADVKRGTDEIMARVAALLPPRYRGIYTDLVPSTSSSATSAGAPTTAAAEGTQSQPS